MTGIYSQVMAPVMSVMLGSRCGECFAMVQDGDKWGHDQWHTNLGERLQIQAAVDESDQAMLQRLLREVLELSQRMPDE